MLTKEQRDEILRLAQMMHGRHYLASDKLVAYLDSITAPRGWYMVPYEPTAEMIEAAMRFDVIHNARPKSEQIAAAIYKAMYDASPAEPGDSNE